MRAYALIALLLLAACGKKGDLAPVPPRLPPVKASAATRPATPAEMLVLPPQSEPDRVDDPVQKSQERPDDRFNLPPTDAR